MPPRAVELGATHASPKAHCSLPKSFPRASHGTADHYQLLQRLLQKHLEHFFPAILPSKFAFHAGSNFDPHVHQPHAEVVFVTRPPSAR